MVGKGVGSDGSCTKFRSEELAVGKRLQMIRKRFGRIDSVRAGKEERKQ